MIWIIFGLLIGGQATAQQAAFRAAVAAEVPPDAPFAVTVTLENLAAEGLPASPDFAPLLLVGGPQTSSNFSMINGDVTRSTTYTYYLQAEKEGTFVIPAFGIESEEGWQQTEALKVTVRAGARAPAARPRRTIPGFEDFFDTRPQTAPRRAPARRRKTYRI